MNSSASPIKPMAPSAGAVLIQDARRLLQIKDASQFHRGVAALASELTASTALVYADQDGTLSFLATRLRIALPAGLLDNREVSAALSAAVKSRSRVVLKLPQSRQVLWALPVECETDIGMALVFDATMLDAEKENRYAQLLSVPQSIFSQRKLQTECDQLQQGVDRISFFLDTLYRSASAPTFKRGMQSLAEDLRSFVGAEYVAIGMGSRFSCKVEALSPASQFDQRSQFMVHTSQLMRESIAVGNSLAWPQEVLPVNPELRLSSDHDLLLDQLKTRAVTCHVLKTAEDEYVGALVCWWAAIPTDEKLSVVEALKPHLSATARMIRQARPKGLLGLYQRHIVEAKLSRLLLIPALLVLFTLAMFIQMPYRLSVPCWIEPQTLRQVAVSFDGVLANSYVKPGDQVKEGQLLAELDGKEIAWKLADVQARINSLIKRRDQALAAENMPDMQLAVLELASLEVERKLLVYQSENLQIKAPIDGIVISGDLAQSAGVPVQRGQQLYDIAPIESFVVKLAVPAPEIQSVRTGMPVSIRLESETQYKEFGTVDTLEPASSVHESKNVFLGTSSLTNEEGRLRPGMQGKARIVSDVRSLGWILFHRPLDFIRLHLPW